MINNRQFYYLYNFYLIFFYDTGQVQHGLKQQGIINSPSPKAIPLKAAVIGAGYMGSAITFPLSANNIEVNLWGTWLDDKIIESSLAGFHPKLKKALPPSVYTHVLQRPRQGTVRY